MKQKITPINSKGLGALVLILIVLGVMSIFFSIIMNYQNQLNQHLGLIRERFDMIEVVNRLGKALNETHLLALANKDLSNNINCPSSTKLFTSTSSQTLSFCLPNSSNGLNSDCTGDFKAVCITTRKMQSSGGGGGGSSSSSTSWCLCQNHGSQEVTDSTVNLKLSPKHNSLWKDLFFPTAFAQTEFTSYKPTLSGNQLVGSFSYSNLITSVLSQANPPTESCSTSYCFRIRVCPGDPSGARCLLNQNESNWLPWMSQVLVLEN